MVKKILVGITVIILLNLSLAYGQDTQQLLKQATEIYMGSSSGSGLTGGFSAWGFMGGILFGSIGFVAFVYGKKNSEFRPMLIGLLLMAYPYFLRGTLALYVTGVGLTAALYIFRE